MPSYKDLLKMIRQGKSPREIHERLQMRPSHWRRMLAGKRFQDALHTREELSGVLALHRMASGVSRAAGRLGDLMDSQNCETVRKVCLALLNEGLAAGRDRPGGSPGGSSSQAGASAPASSSAPWALLRVDDVRSPEEAEGS